MKSLLQHVLKQLSQASTWRGLTMVLTAVGVAVRPELMEQIIVAGTGVSGLIGILISD